MINVEWDGVGLPPVGCECIVDTHWSDNLHIRSFDKQKVKIVMHDVCPEGKSVAVFKMKFNEDRACETYHALVYGNFKPAKSERDKAIEEMRLLWNKRDNCKSFMEQLYDAGYRKVDQ